MADVLIVEDDADAAEALADVMCMEGHEVRIVRDGRDGLRQLKERRSDIVLLDVEMPFLDGPGLAIAMFLHDAGLECIPVVLVSGNPDLERVAATVGTPYFLLKPSKYERLVRTVALALAERVCPQPKAARPA